MRTILGRAATLEDAEAAERAVVEEQVRRARLEFARRHNRRTEVEEVDLVRRGRVLVSATTDRIYRPVQGVVFAPNSATAIADHSELSFYVTSAGELVFLERKSGTWSDVIAKRARRQAVPKPRMRRRVA